LEEISMAEGNAGGGPQFLVHHDGDSVAVATRDLEPGEVRGAVMKGDPAKELTCTLRDRVPLGHKFALVALAEGADIVKYGVRVGIATQPVSPGEYVHVHNMRSARWSSSRAS
jgi:(2R)-sulfolactate sulfo-lyase subunit alpha